LLFIKSQFKPNAQSILHFNQSTHRHYCSWTVASLQRSRGGCECFDTHIKWVDEVSLYFKLQPITLEFVSVHTDDKSKVGRTWGCTSIDRTVFLVLVWLTHSWSLSKHFGCTLYVRQQMMFGLVVVTSLKLLTQALYYSTYM